MTQKELDHIRARDKWREVISEQKASGLSVDKFCVEKKISAHAFRYWQKVITKELLTEAAMVGVLKTPTTMAGVTAVVEAASAAVGIFNTPGVYDLSDEERRALWQKGIEFVLSNEGVGVPNQFVRLTNKILIQELGLSQGKTRAVMHWLEAKGVISPVGREYNRTTGLRSVYLTREQWEQHKDELLDTDATVQQLVQKCGGAIQPVSTSVEPVAEAKNIDTQQQLSVDGVVFDMEHNRLYVPGNATEQTIGVAINILRGLIPQPAVAAPVLT